MVTATLQTMLATVAIVGTIAGLVRLERAPSITSALASDRLVAESDERRVRRLPGCRFHRALRRRRSR
jgi:hypothetical protein